MLFLHIQRLDSKEKEKNNTIDKKRKYRRNYLCTYLHIIYHIIIIICMYICIYVCLFISENFSSLRRHTLLH